MINALGTTVQRRNPYHHPVSIHPSGRTDWSAPHNCQSSRPFHHSDWLDHNWLQTGQSMDRMYNIVQWYNPRTGQTVDIASPPNRGFAWALPARPLPMAEDWVLVVKAGENS